MNTENTKPAVVWSLWGAALLLLCLVFRDSLIEMATTWTNVEEYSHGFFIPIITIYLLWARRGELVLVQEFKASLPGIIIICLGLILFILGGLATIKTMEQYAFLVVLTGMFASAFGMRGLRVGAIPLLFLIFMVPFPSFILNNLSSKLQLISSWLGVEFIRACDIMVYLEGNVIDLGSYKLQVVDACSGLRYLFPLASLAFLCAYLFKGPFWQKLLIFLSSMPLTIFMNSFRIGVIGVLVDNWGTEMAEGFLHDFEGWAVFLLCMLLLFIEMWIFSRISGRKLAMGELVQIPEEWGHTARRDIAAVLNKSVFAVLLLLCVGAGASEIFKGREDIIPGRKAFLTFPTTLGNWQGRNDYLTQFYLNELKLTDYVIVNFTQPETRNSVNFYSAYYQSQRKGAAVHSPRSCIPGDGWQISSFEQREFNDLQLDGQALRVNRAIIQKGESRQLVYFWFQQRGRMITNEYMVKWYLFYDAITMNRTDGALIRLVTPVDKVEDIAVADQRLHLFLRDLLPELPAYLPGKAIVPVHSVLAG
ncbi:MULTISPECIES: VPLPA-CTERM-specific exosortase XrtD [Methylomonas]|uniref:Exosortase D n=2 Tax=Methylomonas TaxID=416 RepID=A0A140E5J6_9GAMM|nr:MULTISPECIES: VPLPA-CTERM-specific exosortase XrtD [Methylomonas]AMK75670.1 exosortase D [Methylomonas denitrificans]OAH98333.1 VPLPA-CTERM-specific exosortase XrtD [Methylomonas methanica]TCV82504.1 exosortase D (VPLPA-CTERM-specific) [Methylomonas methanica]